MVQSIPASAIVQVVPGVLAAGGTGLDLSGLFLSDDSRCPVGAPLSFPSQAEVAAYFGSTSLLAQLATVYFLGFTNSDKKPGQMLIARYPRAAVAGFMRGGRVSGLTLTQLRAITGSLTIQVDGVNKTASSIDLSAVTSFSGAATALNTALAITGMNYDSLSGAFVVTSPTTGASSAIGYATGTAAAALKLTLATGAIISPGAAASDPLTFMDGVKTQTGNWAEFTTTWEVATDEGLSFAQWTNAQDNNYLYVAWDSDILPTETNDSETTLGWRINNEFEYSGTTVVYQDVNHAAFVCAWAASLDTTAHNGRATAAFRTQTGLTASVVDQLIADNLIANGYDFYGAYATRADRFQFFYPGHVSGPFEWLDSYVNQIWLNNAMQLALIELLIAAKSVPYNADGDAMISASLRDPILQAAAFGAIRSGIRLSELQKAEINAEAGITIDQILSTRGWYLFSNAAGTLPQVRAQRGSPQVKLWYTDGQSVQTIKLNSILVQ